MKVSPLTTSIEKSFYNGQSRNGSKVERVILHHTTAFHLGPATTFMKNKNSRSSCSTYLLGQGKIIALIGEEFRPSSTRSDRDANSITIELLNETGAPDWKVRDEDLENVSRLLADFSTRYGWGKLNRTNVRIHRDFVATACPGPYVVSRLGAIIARANEILEESKPSPPKPPSPEKESDMALERVHRAFRRTNRQRVTAGNTMPLRYNDANDISVATKPGNVWGTLQLQIDGGEAYSGVVRVTPLVRKFRDGKTVPGSERARYPREIVFSTGHTFGEINVNEVLGDEERLSFTVGASDFDFEVVSAVFTGFLNPSS